MSGHRQSALLLHGLPEADRRWILARLAAEDQRILDEHLAELKSLGIPADPALTGAQPSALKTIDAAAPPQQSIAADPVQAASAAQMRAILADEPVWLVRQVLALDNWPWRQDYLAALPPAQRERLRVSGDAPMAGDGKLAERLRAQLAQRLAGFDLDRAGLRPAQAQVQYGLLSSIHKAVRRWL